MQKKMYVPFGHDRHQNLYNMVVKDYSMFGVFFIFTTSPPFTSIRCNLDNSSHIKYMRYRFDGLLTPIKFKGSKCK